MERLKMIFFEKILKIVQWEINIHCKVTVSPHHFVDFFLPKIVYQNNVLIQLDLYQKYIVYINNLNNHINLI